LAFCALGNTLFAPNQIDVEKLHIPQNESFVPLACQKKFKKCQLTGLNHKNLRLSAVETFTEGEGENQSGI